MDVTQSKHLQPWLGSSYQSVTDETTFWGENVIWDQCTCLLLAVNIIVLSRESRSSLLRIGDRVSFCARSWSWSKETYLSGKMSVISFSNQFSGCFSHNSGDFLPCTRTEDPFIPCLYLSPQYHTMPLCTTPSSQCTTRWNWLQEGSIPLYHACLSTARPLPTVSCASFSVHHHGCSTLAEAKTWNSLGTDFSVLLDPSEGLSSNLCLTSQI